MGILKKLFGSSDSDIVQLSKMAMDRGNVDFEVIEGSDGSVSFSVTGRQPSTNTGGKKQKQQPQPQHQQQDYQGRNGRNGGRPNHHGRPN